MYALSVVFTQKTALPLCMLYKTLGTSALCISAIGFGCMSLAMDDKTASTRVIHRAMEKGINFFDTADLYNKGLNEIMLGKALAAKRNDVIIATKVGNQWRPDGSGWDWNPTKKYILDAVEKSLRRLQTDYIDLYQLHGGTNEDPIDETIGAFELLKQQGKIRYYGLSSIRPNVIREYVKRAAISSVLLQYSVADRRPEETILPLLKEHNIGILSRGGLAQGLLVKKPTKQYLQHTEEAIANAAKLMNELSTPERSAAQTALRFVLQQPAVTSTVVGIRNEEQLQDAVKAVSATPLTSTEMEHLKTILPPGFYEANR